MCYSVKLSHSSYTEAVEWAQKHCPSYVGNNLTTSTEDGDVILITGSHEVMRIDSSGNIGIGFAMIEYHFKNSEDAVAFRLRWA